MLSWLFLLQSPISSCGRGLHWKHRCLETTESHQAVQWEGYEQECFEIWWYEWRIHDQLIFAKKNTEKHLQELTMNIVITCVIAITCHQMLTLCFVWVSQTHLGVWPIDSFKRSSLIEELFLHCSINYQYCRTYFSKTYFSSTFLSCCCGCGL